MFIDMRIIISNIQKNIKTQMIEAKGINEIFQGLNTDHKRTGEVGKISHNTENTWLNQIFTQVLDNPDIQIQDYYHALAYIIIHRVNILDIPCIKQDKTFKSKVLLKKRMLAMKRNRNGITYSLKTTPKPRVLSA